MIYLTSFSFPDIEQEYTFYFRLRRTCYDTCYPFGILSKHSFRRIDFEPVTILYGGNGSGKSTALNIIAQKAALKRDSIYNQSSFFPDYTALCQMETNGPLPEESRIITSDDVFDYMLNIRCLNQGIDTKREDLFKEYLDNKHGHFQMRSFDDYEKLQKVNASRSKSQSRYVREALMDNVREYSNGESAYLYFTEHLSEHTLCLLDEPENSLSPARQIELLKYIEDSARFFGCQFVISTHSPFLLSIRGAKIYDLDSDPVDVRKWTELENVRIYYDFFRQHKAEFQR